MMKRQEMQEIRERSFSGERALFASQGVHVCDCVFENGESPLKESRDVAAERCLFKWRYPLWYCRNVEVTDSFFFEDARAGVWYTDDISIRDTIIQSPKTLRRCHRMTLCNVQIPSATETLWACEDVTLENVSVKGDYFAMNSSDLHIKGLSLVGKYSFDGVKNVTIEDSRFLTKDAFWNSENVTVKNSYISGEYLGWNAKNLTLIDCTVESLQGLCYVDNLVMKNCRLVNTTLAFEYSTVDADITSKADSVLNPSGGTIRAEAIGELIIEKDRIDPAKTHITCREIGKQSPHPDWIA